MKAFENNAFLQKFKHGVKRILSPTEHISMRNFFCPLACLFNVSFTNVIYMILSYVYSIMYTVQLGLGSLGWSPWVGLLGLGSLGWAPWVGLLGLGSLGWAPWVGLLSWLIV